jgi:hypothetical protein
VLRSSPAAAGSAMLRMQREIKITIIGLATNYFINQLMKTTIQ